MLHLAMKSDMGVTCRVDYISNTLPLTEPHLIEEPRTIPSWELIGYNFVVGKELKEEPMNMSTGQPLQLN